MPEIYLERIVSKGMPCVSMSVRYILRLINDLSFVFLHESRSSAGGEAGRRCHSDVIIENRFPFSKKHSGSYCSRQKYNDRVNTIIGYALQIYI